MDFDLKNSQYRARQVRLKTQEVADYHYDETKPGKPLRLLVPGGIVALLSLAVIVYVVYQTWYAHQIAMPDAYVYLTFLAPFYIAGVFTFSYGYELYDLKRAIRLTIIIVLITVLVLVIGASLLTLAGGGLKGLSKGSSRKSSSSGSSSSSGRSSGSSSHASTAHSGSSNKPAVQPVVCPSCGHVYVASQFNGICPNCGALAPK